MKIIIKQPLILDILSKYEAMEDPTHHPLREKVVFKIISKDLHIYSVYNTDLCLYYIAKNAVDNTCEPFTLRKEQVYMLFSYYAENKHIYTRPKYASQNYPVLLYDKEYLSFEDKKYEHKEIDPYDNKIFNIFQNKARMYISGLRHNALRPFYLKMYSKLNKITTIDTRFMYSYTDRYAIMPL